MSYSPLVLLFYSAGLYTSGFSTTEWESAHKTGLALKPNTKDFFWEMEGKASWGAHRWGLQLCRGCVGLRCYGDSKRAVFQYHLPYAICYSVSLDFFVSIPVKFHIQDCLEMFFCSKKHRNVYERLHYYCLPASSVIIVHTKITCQNWHSFKIHLNTSLLTKRECSFPHTQHIWCETVLFYD